MSNCRPGDMAVVIKGDPDINIGRVIKVLAVDEFASSRMSSPMWNYEGFLDSRWGTRCTAVSDCCLRPLRDPGDDAVDEVIQRIGRPAETVRDVIEAARA